VITKHSSNKTGELTRCHLYGAFIKTISFATDHLVHKTKADSVPDGCWTQIKKQSRAASPSVGYSHSSTATIAIRYITRCYADSMIIITATSCKEFLRTDCTSQKSYFFNANLWCRNITSLRTVQHSHRWPKTSIQEPGCWIKCFDMYKIRAN